MARQYGTVLTLGVVALVAVALIVKVWTARLRSLYEARPRPQVLRARGLHTSAYGRSPSAQANSRPGSEPEYLEAARRNLESQLGRTLHSHVEKGRAVVKS